ncbi:hypothetical protein [Microvirga vignae]|uniref:hypothetical protein n=1 Tax=Microvirga vignae TaxID=1225564 RepID=UPI000AD49E2E|nr:hypothetical protein [Microvirga vignae]
MAAALDDVVEDCPEWSRVRFAEGFSSSVLAAVDSLTRRDGEAYMDFIARCSRDPIAPIVKQADLEDNLNLGHMPVRWTRTRLESSVTGTPCPS